MAAAVCLQTIVLVKLFLLCSGYYYDYYDYNYGDYGSDPSSWCPFGINGMCACTNDIVNCTTQGMSAIPPGLPTTITQLILRDNQISSLDFLPLATFASLEHLDLSSNNLATLPQGLFESLGSLKTINISNNPWKCDCTLSWLSVWLLTAGDNGITVLDSSSTNCVEWPSSSILDISPAEFLPCAVAPRLPRSVAAASTVSSNWTTACPYWFSASHCNHGPTQAGSCLLSHDSHHAAVVTYSSFTGQSDADSCRSYCFSGNFSYHAFHTSSLQCMCGEELGTAQCSDCSTSTLLSSGLTVCSGSYLRVTSASHVLSDLAVTVPSPVTTHTPITFTLSGVPSLVTSFSWNFGDGAKQGSLQAATATHTYLYPGLFPLAVELCGSGVCRTAVVSVKVSGQTLYSNLTCPAGVVEVSGEISLTFSLLSLASTAVRWSRASSAGTEYAGECESGWVLFHGRCVRHVVDSKNITEAEAACQQMGATLMCLDHLVEELEIPTLVGLTASTTAWIGAMHDGSKYQWMATSTPATLLQALYVNLNAGNCLVMSLYGLAAADCDSQHEILCQKDPNPCPVGTQYGSTGMCYVLETQSVSWQDARQTCQSTYSDLAVFSSPTDGAAVASSLGITGTTWIGLASPDLLGHYTWVDGESHTLSTSSGQSSVQWPCVGISPSGQEEPTDCSQTLPYICQYSLTSAVTSDLHVAGTPDLENSGSSFQVLSEYSSALPASAGQSVILPGVWFTRDGQLLEVNLNVAQRQASSIVAIQVLRPTCTSGKTLVQPGCDQNVFSKCSTSTTSCSSFSTCSRDGEHLCPLTNSCIMSSSPCSCAMAASVTVQCSATDPPADMTYKLIGQALFEIPASGGSYRAELSSSIDVHVNDVLAFQSMDSVLGFCHTDAASEWRQVAFVTSQSSWTNINDAISLSSSYTKQEDYVCLAGVLYGTPKTYSLPSSLAYVPDATLYTFQVGEVNTAATPQSCVVETVQQVGDLSWLYPEFSLSATQPTVYVQANTAQNLVAIVASGSDIQVQWELDSGSVALGVPQASCPGSVPPRITQCQEPNSQLLEPFLVYSGTFPTSSPVSVNLNASNLFGWKALSVKVIAVEPIQNLVLSHSACVPALACNSLLEVGVSYDFMTTMTSGDASEFQFMINGTFLLSGPFPNLTHTFPLPGCYEMAVNASNGLETVEAVIVVSVKVRANVNGPALEPSSPIIMEAGQNATFTLKASINKQAEVTIIWDFGDGLSESSTSQINSYSLNAYKEHAYPVAGVYTLTVHIKDAFGVETNVTGVVNVLSVLTNLNVSVSPQITSAGNASIITAYVVPSSTASVYFDTLTYVFNFNDGSADESYTTNQTVQSVSHVYHTNGTFNMSVTVSNQVSSATGYAVVDVQVCPTRVVLSYNGPKNLSELLTFQATPDQGSDLSYQFNFGNGAAPITTSHPSVTFTYNTSGTYNASVLVNNSVCQVVDFTNVIAMDANTLVVKKISHNQYAAINELVFFTVDMVTLDVQKVNLVVRFGSFSLPLRGFSNFSFIFMTEGNHTVNVKVSLDSGVTKHTSTIITIQEPVTNVNMTAPSLVSFSENQPAVENFTATSLDGTDVDFNWFNNSASLSLQGANISLTFNSSGVFNISVMAYNEVSNVGTSLMVVVQHVVENIVITCTNCLNTWFIAANKKAIFHCSYLGTNVTIVWKVGTNTLANGIYVSNTFLVTGFFNISTHVSNLVSSDMASFILAVEEEVSLLNLTADQAVVSEGSDIRLTATHSGGTNVEYTWSCDTQGGYSTPLNSTLVSFPTWGLYTCNVTVANNVSTQTASVSLKVLQNITHLGIKNHAGSNLLYAPMNKLPGIEANCSTSFEVNFTWNVIKSGAVISTVSGSVLSYLFTSPAQYQLILNAVNDISSLSIQMTVEVQEEISHLQVLANDTSVAVGDGVKLTASIAAGTNPTFHWSLNSMPLLVSSQSFDYSFSSAATFVIKVTVSNEVSTDTVNITILVQHVVENITISSVLDMLKPYINQNQQVNFQANVSKGSLPVYEWTVTLPSLSQQHLIGNLLQQNFTQTGSYTIQLVVSNTVSQERESVVVYVEKAITSLSLSMKPFRYVATGATIVFSGFPNSDATPVSYLWAIEGQNMTSASVSHMFTHTGVYIIKLEVYNNISREGVNETVYVQDQITGLQILDCNLTRKALVSTTLTATAQGTNISYYWTVQFPHNNRSSTSSSLTQIYPSGGIYPVYLLAENNVTQDTQTCMLTVQDTIANVAVAITYPPVDYIFTKQNVTFVVSGNYLSGATYTWNFTGLFTNISYSPVFVMSFDTAQTITLEVTVSNDVSSMSALVNFTVQDLQCYLPIVTPVGRDPRSVLRSRSAQFDVYIDNKGCTQYRAIHTWKVYPGVNCSQTLPSSGVNLASVDFTLPTLILPMSLLPTTTSHFCVHYTMGYQNTPVAEEVSYNLQALSTPLVAVIAGGAGRQVDGAGQVCLDGSASYNPDDPDAGSSGMTFDWACHVRSGGGSCFNAVTGGSSVLCVSTLTSGTYNITLTVSLPGQTAHTTSQQLEVVVAVPPVLSVGVECVSCQATGDYRVSSSHHTVLSAHCQGCNVSLTYTWQVTDDTGANVTLGDDDTSTGTSAANLVVLRGQALQDNRAYTFTVTMVAADGSRSQSTAYMTLLPNSPPSGGICTATPTTITPLQDQVTITCSGWLDVDDAESELLYEVKAVEGSQSYLVYYGTRATQSIYLAPQSGSTSNSTQLVVTVLDDAGARTEALSETITFSNMGIPTSNLSEALYVSANSTLTALMEQGDPVPLMQYAMAMTQMLNAASTTSALQSQAQETQALVRSAITLCVSTSVPVNTLQQAQQMAELLSMLTEFSEEYQSSGCHTLMLLSLQNIVTVLNSSVRPGLDRQDYPFQSLLSAVYHLTSAVNQGSTSTSSSTSSINSAFPQLAGLSPDLLLALQVLDFSGNSLGLDHKKNIVTESLTVAEDVTSVVLRSMVLDEASLNYQLGNMEVEGSRSTADSVTSYMVMGGCRFILPSAILSGIDSSEEVLRIMIMLHTNPYTWGYIDQLTISSRVPSLSFKYANGSDFSVSDLQSTIELLMFDSNGNNYTVTNGSLVDSPHYDPLANSVFDTWTLEAGGSKKLEVNAGMGTSGISALHIQIRVEALPNKTDAALGITPSAAIQCYLGAGFEASRDSYTYYKEITTSHMASGVDHRLYTFFVPEGTFNAGTNYQVTLYNEDQGHDVNVSATLYLSSCQYYNEGGQKWAATGCSVSEESIPLATVCHCNHLTAFGSGSLVPISSINFSDLAKLELGLNPVVLVAVCAILLLYIIGVIICRHLDRTDLCRISTVPLCGRDGVFKYHITVITGRQIGAGSTAHVGIKLYGDHSKSEPRHLTKNAAFQRNSRDTFLIATDNELGNLHKLRVWHDNTGSSPAWYLSQIQVQDLQSGQLFIFPANTWLSLEEKDGMLQKEICAAAPEELHCFSRVFHTSLYNNMAERHMWLSVFNRPDHSRFTRVQRATCCLTLVYLYMFLNAMWYGLIKDQSDANKSISWNVIGWEELVIALVSGATIFPIALLLIFIFKRSRSKEDVFKQAMRPPSAQTLEIECDVSHYGGSLRTMTPYEDWSTIFERESTTESIPISPRSPRSVQSPLSCRSPLSPRSPRFLQTPEIHRTCSPQVPSDAEQPISSQLRRTTAVARSARESGTHASFPGSSKKSTVQCIRRTQDLMWNQENILKSWPEKLPSFAEEEREKASMKAGTPGTSTSTTGAAQNSGSAGASQAKTTETATTGKISKTTSLPGKTSQAPALKKSKSAPAKPGSKPSGSKVSAEPRTAESKTKSETQSSAAPMITHKSASFKKDAENDSDDHEEFMQRLDELDRQLKKSASARSKASLKSRKAKGLVKKHSSKSSQGAIEDLFESDDEWANEGLDTKGGREGPAFNPRQDPNLDRRASVNSLLRLRAASMHVPSSAGSSFLRRDSTFMRRDSTMQSFMMSEKSRTTLSAVLKNRMQMMGSPADQVGCRLPWFCVYVGYAICLGLSVLSILMVLLYGYNFGSAVALEWLLSVFLAFLLSMFVLEPLKVVILTLYVAVIVKDAEKDVESDSIDVMPSIEANEQLKEVKFRPLGGFALLQAQEEGRKKLRLRTMIRQSLAYLLLTATLLAVANLYFGPAFFRATGHMENSFVYTDATTTGSIDLYNISSTDAFWGWARDVWTPALYRSRLVSSEENPVLLGPARVRQIRSTSVDCLTDEADKRQWCVGRLDFEEDTTTYGIGWLNTSVSNESWIYSTANQLNTCSKFGQDLFYTGGGYVQELGTSYNQTLDTLQLLDDAGWLDRRTRALFLEWTSYSAPEDLFSAVTLLLEFPISGGVLVSHTINTQRLYLFQPDKVDALYICQVLLFIPAIYLLVQTLLAVCEQRSAFLRCPGNWLQMVSALLCLVGIGLYFACVAMATEVVDRFGGHWASFTNFERVVHLHEILRFVHACLLFLLFLKIAGQLRYVRVLSVYQRTLALASGRLMGATLIFLILLLTYTQIGYLFYGSFVHSYRSFQTSLMTLFGVMKGSVNFDPVLEHQPIFSHFFFLSFYAFVYGLFVALIIAVMQDAYKLTRSQMYFKSTLEPQDYEMIDFMLKRLKLWMGIIKPKPAFRRVKFDGLPSLPSRGSSSATSSRRPLSQNSREHSTPTPDLISTLNNVVDPMDRLLPAWEKLLSLLGTVETLEKEEQRQVGKVETAFNRWNGDRGKKTKSGYTKNKKSPGRPMGKPPVDPKSKVKRLSGQSGSSDQSSAAATTLRNSVTPPPSSSRPEPALPPGKPMVRTLSDQGTGSFGVLEKPSADAQRTHPASASGLKKTSPELKDVTSEDKNSSTAGSTESTDAFPGSTARRCPPGNQASWSGASAAVSDQQPGTSAVGEKGPVVGVKKGLKRTASNKTAPEDNKKQAWDG